MRRLEGSCALITGGSRGIGAATALTFAREGAQVGIMGKTEKSLSEMKRAAAGETTALETFQGDVGRTDAAARCVAEFVDRIGRNNACIGIGRPFFDKTVDRNETLRFNLVGKS